MSAEPGNPDELVKPARGTVEDVAQRTAAAHDRIERPISEPRKIQDIDHFASLHVPLESLQFGVLPVQL
ncbi:MAG TPA: hypothetical protein VGR41_05990 [Actinomycetota bacterium]|nr:hypothetical protein [Actinomycetota bacterium]